MKVSSRPTTQSCDLLCCSESHFFVVSSFAFVILCRIVWALARMVTSAVKKGGDAASILRLESGDVKQRRGPDGSLRRPRKRQHYTIIQITLFRSTLDCIAQILDVHELFALIQKQTSPMLFIQIVLLQKNRTLLVEFRRLKIEQNDFQIPALNILWDYFYHAR